MCMFLVLGWLIMLFFGFIIVLRVNQIIVIMVMGLVQICRIKSLLFLFLELNFLFSKLHDFALVHFDQHADRSYAFGTIDIV